MSGRRSTAGPIKKHGGLSVWHYLDRSHIINQARYESGDIEDERRLFYVAVTRAIKFLFLTRSQYSNFKERSVFLTEAIHSNYIVQHDDKVNYKNRNITNTEPEQSEILLNFSVLEDYYRCSYRFKLTYLYGFMQPLVEYMGYGRSLHDIVMDLIEPMRTKEKLKKMSLHG